MRNLVDSLLKHGDYREISSLPLITIDLRYASTNNFTGENIYGEFNKAFLHKLAAEKLLLAIQLLQKINSTRNHPGHYQFLVFDALRPRSAQWKLWNKVVGTPQGPYIADPREGSIHNYGMSIDLTLIDNQSGKELDMGTEFDDFSPLAQPTLEEDFFRKGILGQQQMANRALLRNVMEQAGFRQLSIEWWHYDALPEEEVRGKYQIIS